MKMKFWTIQNKSIKDNLNREGFYQPDFKKSRYLFNNKKLRIIYDFLLKSFNKVNNTSFPGLIFAFATYDDKSVLEINDIESFITLMRNDYLNAFITNLDKNNVAIFELDYFVNFNPIFVEYNNFQTIMPSPNLALFHSEQELSQILVSIEKGECIFAQRPCGLFQAHLPNIKQENILNEYDINYFL